MPATPQTLAISWGSATTSVVPQGSTALAKFCGVSMVDSMCRWASMRPGTRGRFLQSTTSRASGAGQSANGRTARMCPSPTSTVLSSRTSRPKTSTTRMHKGQIAGDLPKTHGFSPAQCLTVPVHAAFLPEFLSRALPAVCLRQGPGLCPCVPNGFSQAFPRDRFSEALRDNTKMQDSRPTLAQEPVCRKACIPPFFSV